MDILLIDAPGGPQPGELAEVMAPYRPLRVISVRWGGPELHARRLGALGALGPVEVVSRPDQVIEAGLAAAADRRCTAVVAFSEIVSFYAGLLARLLGLPGNPPEALVAVRHKHHQRRLLAGAGVPSPAARTVTAAQDLAGCASLRFPVILKPSTGVGSLCVSRAADIAELTAAYVTARRHYDADPRPNGATPVFVAEEEISGTRWHQDSRFGHRFAPRVSVESLVHDGVVYHLGVTDKLPLAPPFREVGHITPSLLDHARIVLVQKVAERAIKAVGLISGAVHTELMLTADGAAVIEVNGRLGGGVYELMKFSRGYDVVQGIVDTARGRAPALPGAATRYAAFIKPQPPQGRFQVTAIDTEAFSQAMSLADWGVLDKREGAIVDSRSGTNTNVARFIVTADTPAELFGKIDAVTTAVWDSVTAEAAS